MLTPEFTPAIAQIIHSRWILTASHCLENIVRVEVYIGAINRFKSGVGAYIKAINITESRSIILHPKYNPQLFANDIGLLKLPEEVPNNNVYVRTLALPRGVDATMNLVGRQGIVAGFGEAKFIAQSFFAIISASFSTKGDFRTRMGTLQKFLTTSLFRLWRIPFAATFTRFSWSLEPAFASPASASAACAKGNKN